MKSNASTNERITAKLKAVMPKPDTSLLAEAMHYVMFNGGKRLRPALVYAAAEVFNADLSVVDDAACAVELIHCYSLVHDDLPAMDDDDLRRGKPSCHKAFNEAVAILVGDALQSLAFEVLASSPVSAARVVKMSQLLAHASGVNGMAGGQSLDLLAESSLIDLKALKKIHELKTGAIIRASVQLGAMAAGCQDEKTLEQLGQFAEKLGLAFQIRDDILDVESNTETLGKPVGSDIALDKNTYVSLLGLSAAKIELQKVCDEAIAMLEKVSASGSTESLKALCLYVQSRSH